MMKHSLLLYVAASLIIGGGGSLRHDAYRLQ